MLVTEPITEDWIPGVVDVHMDAFRGYMNASIGREYVSRFISWFASRDGAIALAAVKDGRVTGYVVGAPVGYSGEMNRDLFWTVARAMALRPWLLLQKRFFVRLLQRAKQLFVSQSEAVHALPSLPEPVMSLVGIAVADFARGSGVGSVLMREFEDRSLAARCKSMRLSVYASNVSARALYERQGWTLLGDPAGDALYYFRILEPPKSK